MLERGDGRRTVAEVQVEEEDDDAVEARERLRAVQRRRKLEEEEAAARARTVKVVARDGRRWQNWWCGWRASRR